MDDAIGSAIEPNRSCGRMIPPPILLLVLSASGARNRLRRSAEKGLQDNAFFEHE